MRRHRWLVALVAALGLLLAGCTGGQRDEDRTVGVQMFQWTWNAIADECERTLGPAGYGWVLTSPPQEHILGEQWWTAYQPVSYLIESRLGTREEFADMVERCNDVGVEVYADAVINHMTGTADDAGEQTGWAGSTFTHYDYPGIWTTDDFHHCGSPNDDIGNYSDPAEVRDCELVNLADLKTGEPHVQERLTAYLEDLVSLGVGGFRIDAAKHMLPEDIAAIIEPLPDDIAILQEVIRGAGEPITPEQYTGNGLVYEFAWGQDLYRMLSIGSLEPFADLGSSGMLPSAEAVAFVDNHDTERNRSTLSYSDGELYQLATVLLLATDYGTPSVYSGYAFSSTDAGPPQDADGAVLDATCAPDPGPTASLQDGDWVCTQAWPAVTGMVGFHNATLGQDVTNWWGNDEQIAFGRGEAGFVVVNKDDAAYSGEWTTSLPAGTYCDVIAGPMVDGACAGATIEVGDDGTFAAEVGAVSAIALHVQAQPD